ncbi:MAG: hypothetical protein AAGG01_15230 [Planctomycetota bacterium]
MILQLLHIALWGAGAYVALGALFSIPFVLIGAGRIDPDAREGTWGFRALILPGAVLLWPLLAKRWAQAGPDGSVPRERTPHKSRLSSAEGAPS